MSKIRYLSDGALRYIKSRLDSIEKKLNGSGNITTPKNCEILSIITSDIFTYYNVDTDNIEYIDMPNYTNGIIEYPNGNIVISVDNKRYNINAFIYNGDIYSNIGYIGTLKYRVIGVQKSVAVVNIDCIIDNKKINITAEYNEYTIKDINTIDATYLVNKTRSVVDLSSTTFDDMCEAKTITINDFCYVINSIDVSNKIINLIAISAPLNRYNFEVQVQFVNGKIRLKSKNSKYINIKP